MTKDDETVVVELIRLKNHGKAMLAEYEKASSDRKVELSGIIGKYWEDVRKAEKRLRNRARQSDDRRLLVLAGHLSNGMSLSTCARAFGYSREGVKKILSKYRKKSK